MGAGELWGYIIGGLGALMGFVGWLRNSKGDVTQQASWMGSVNAKLDYIVGELAKLGDIRERVSVLERDVKTAFKRSDEANKRIDETNKRIDEIKGDIK